MKTTRLRVENKYLTALVSGTIVMVFGLARCGAQDALDRAFMYPDSDEISTMEEHIAIPEDMPRAARATVRVDAATAASIDLVPFRDPWPAGRQRWWDISNTSERRYDAFLDGSQEFDYGGEYSDPRRITKVTLTYDKSPGVPYFVGHIEARGLKPNFCYQIKLLGKPVYGKRGNGPYVARDTTGDIVSVPNGGGEDWANEQLGYIGRWWCDTAHATQTNFDDEHYLSAYKNATPGQQHSMYGYQYLGMFVTDRRGNASIDFTGQSSYHVTWAQWQGGIKDVEDAHSPFTISGDLIQSQPPVYYGYGAAAPTAAVRLFYEYEPNGRPRNNVRLPDGVYHCRLLLTEESFHNSEPEGGYWNGVLATEDYNYDAIGSQVTPDTIASNDVVFTIGGAMAPPAPPTGLTARADSSGIELSWEAASEAAYYKIKRATQPGGPYTTIGGGMPTRDAAYLDATVAPGTPYYYVVSVVRAGLESLHSNEVAVLPPHSRPPSAPVNLTATPVSSSQIRLNWRDTASTEDGFKIERSTDGVRFVEIKWLGPNARAFTDAGLRSATLYYYRLRAYNGGGASAYSSAVRAVTRVAPPIAPVRLSATPTASGGVILQWSDRSSNETSFAVERWANGVIAPLATAPANSTRFTDNRVLPNTLYYYYVRAYGLGGFSVRSNPAIVRTPPAGG